MYGHWIYLEELPEKFLESQISGTLETKGVTKTGAAPLYKAPSSKFILILESKAAREKL